MRRTVAAAGPTSAAEAWERYAVVSRWPSWAPPIVDVTASAGRLETGMTGVVHTLFRLPVTFVVTAVDEAARTWSWRVRCGPVRMWLRHEVLATADGGAATTLTVEGPAPLVLLYPEVTRVALSRLVG